MPLRPEFQLPDSPTVRRLRSLTLRSTRDARGCPATSQMTAAQALSLLRATLETTADGILVVDREGHVTSFNQHFARMWRVPKAILAARDDDRLVAFMLNQLAEPEAFLKKVKRLYGDTEAESFDTLTFKDGRIFERYSRPQRMGNKIVGRVWSFRDVTERKRAEEALQRALAWQEAAFEGSRDAVFVSDRDARFVLVNAAACALTLYPREELLTKRIPDLHEAPDLEAYRRYHARIMAGEEAVTEARVRRRDGTKVEVEFNNRRIAIGGVWYMHTVARDVTERKRTERELQRRERQLAEAQALARLGSWEWDICEDEVRWSDEMYLIHGLAPQERGLNLEHVLTFIVPEDRAVIREDIAHILQQAQARFHLLGERDISIPPVQYRITRREGETRTLYGGGRLLLDEAGRPARMVGTVLDVTEQTQAAQALRESRRKLRLLSHRLLRLQEDERTRIARELHDQIGQALTAVKLHLEALRGTLPAHLKPLTEGLRLMDRALEQVRTLSFDLRPSMLDDLGLAVALKSYARRQAAAAGLRLHLKTPSLLAEIPPQVQTTCFRIAQEAITNVIRHARAHHLHVALTQRNGALELVVQDDGVGFASTSLMQGSELGFLGMQERAEAVQGALDVVSQPGRGTTVRVSLPLNGAGKGAVR